MKKFKLLTANLKFSFLPFKMTKKCSVLPFKMTCNHGNPIPDHYVLLWASQLLLLFSLAQHVWWRGRGKVLGTEWRTSPKTRLMAWRWVPSGTEWRSSPKTRLMAWRWVLPSGNWMEIISYDGRGGGCLRGTEWTTSPKMLETIEFVHIQTIWTCSYYWPETKQLNLRT